jgi:sugar transferase (PEP-CTERM system associated)
MVRIFGHHVPIWAPFALVSDLLLCFAAILVADARVPINEFGATRPFAHPDALLWAAAFAVFMAMLYSFFGLYRQGSTQVTLSALLRRSLVALFIGSAIAYAALDQDGTRAHGLLLLLYSVPLMAVGVMTVRGVGHLARSADVGARRVLIVGTGPDARSVASDLSLPSRRRHGVVGFYRTSAEGDQAGIVDELKLPVFDGRTSLDEIVRAYRVDEIIVAVREQRGGAVPMDELLACRIRGTKVMDLAGFFERVRGEVPTDSLKTSWLVYGHGFVQHSLRAAIKRAFDLFMSMVLLLIASPIMVITAIAIKFESAGPVLYRQERVGLRGRHFMCIKFRSMRVDAEKDGIARWATKSDSRVTRVGAFIRKCRIDELPQLISVLRGEMSLIGPRPERQAFVDQLRQEIPFYDLRHSVKPGVTGWAQVRYGYCATVDDAKRKHQFDLYYVKNHSLFLDLLVLIETVSVVLFREGAQ